MKKLLVLSSVVLFSSFANAGGFIEPYIGYQTGKVEDSNDSIDTKGTALGLRAGYQWIIPWVALDVKMFKGTTETTPEGDLTFTDVGVTVGASVPFLRPFIGYIPAAKQKLEVGSATDEFEGTGLKLGLGIKILPLIDINIEQVNYEFDKLDGLTLTDKVTHKTTMIGLGITF